MTRLLLFNKYTGNYKSKLIYPPKKSYLNDALSQNLVLRVSIWVVLSTCNTFAITSLNVQIPPNFKTSSNVTSSMKPSPCSPKKLCHISLNFHGPSLPWGHLGLSVRYYTYSAQYQLIALTLKRVSINNLFNKWMMIA